MSSELLECTPLEFVNGCFDSEWALPHLDAHKAYMDYLIWEYGVDNTRPVVTMLHGMVSTPPTGLFNLYAAPCDLKKELDNPQRPMDVDDSNASFIQLEYEEPRGIPMVYPYSVCGENFIASLPKRKRDNFKHSLKGEEEVFLEEIPKPNFQWKSIYLQKSQQYKEHVGSVISSLANRDGVRYFVANQKVDGELEAVAALAICRDVYPEHGPVNYVVVFSSIEPCVRQVHLQLVEKIIPAGELLHYGASESFDDKTSKVFRYKKLVANKELTTHYYMIIKPEPFPPYYDLGFGKWRT